jgi:hypothetical protein
MIKGAEPLFIIVKSWTTFTPSSTGWNSNAFSGKKTAGESDPVAAAAGKADASNIQTIESIQTNRVRFKIIPVSPQVLRKWFIISLANFEFLILGGQAAKVKAAGELAQAQTTRQGLNFDMVLTGREQGMARVITS